MFWSRVASDWPRAAERLDAQGCAQLPMLLTASECDAVKVAILLAEPGRDFTGGEFVLTEQRPRMQARPMVSSLQKGDALVFAVNQRPVPGKRGMHRVKVRHGVSRIHSGRRHTLGIIFHDAS